MPPLPHSNADVRMRGFTSRATVEEVFTWLDAQTDSLREECVPIVEAAGRVLSRDVVSDIDVPGFDRAMMDGFAVRADETLGASSYNPLPLKIIGQCLPGESFAGTLAAGQAVQIMTGAPLPEGADAVLPAEQAEASGDTLRVEGEVSPGKHVGRRGEDIAAGAKLLSAARRLRPQDVGVLSSVGVAKVNLVRRPQVRIVVTGNELLPAGTPPSGCQIADANGPMLEALVCRDGGVPQNPGIVKDDRAEIEAALFSDADVILVSGGSSVGQEDHVPTLLAELGELAIHGVAMRPSSPVGLGRLENRLVFLLPGNPVSCLCAYDFFAGRAIRALGGIGRVRPGSDASKTPWSFPYATVAVPLRRKLVSVVGRVDYARVRLTGSQVEPLAVSGASILSSTTRADGFVVVPGDSEGYGAGVNVTVHLYDRVMG